MRLAVWAGSLLSIGLAYVIAMAIKSDMASFRPCSYNNTDLVVLNCGKQSLNSGDYLIFSLFVLSVLLVVGLLVASWRLTWRRSA